MELLCPWESPLYLIFSSNAPNLFYYSHFLALFATLIFIYVLLSKFRESSSIKFLSITLFLFLLWTGIDVLLWASNRPDIVLFYWSLQILIEMLMYAGTFYLAYIFINKRDLPFILKIGLTVLILPIVILLPTNHLLPGIDASYCDAFESSFVVFYTYSVEIFLILSTLFLTFKEINKNTSRRREVLFFSTGLIVFLLALSSGNIIGSITENWTLAQIGLFGMPIFISFLAYTIVKFKSFNIELLGAQALVVSLWLLIGSLLLVRSIENIRIITSITLILLLIVGTQLVRSVRREVKQRKDLQIANEGQANLIHIMNHQIRGYLAKGRNIFSELLTESEYKLAGEAKPLVDEGLKSLTEGVDFVQQILKGSSAESGKLVYNMESVELRSIVSTSKDELVESAQKKGLTLNFKADQEEYKITGDKIQLKEAVTNLISNSINYTEKGSIDVSLTKKADKVLLTVKDTGIGISKEDMPRLFQKGGRGKDSLKHNVNSTGYGLAFAKAVVEAHKGRIWVESLGSGKGSAFSVELPSA